MGWVCPAGMVGRPSCQPLPWSMCVCSQGNQMSIAFLELAYPPPGHIHRGQLQLVEVSRAGLDPSPAQEGPKGAIVSILTVLHKGARW